MIMFPFSDYWALYVGFTLFVIFLLILDLGVFHRKVHEVSFKEASAWTAVWISLALLFNYAFYQYCLYKFNGIALPPELAALGAQGLAKQFGLEFLTGFVVEKSLAIDNIFVFAIVFSYFAIPKLYQHRILFWGIMGALFFRAIFISMGSILMQYHAVVVFFGVLLIGTGIKMFFAGTEKQDLDKNLMVKLLKKYFRFHPNLVGEKFFVRTNGLLYATPLFAALVVIELTDIIFAVDSVPAIFALTREPLIVYTSNIFAILGLRSMYFMLAGVMDRFIYIKYGLAAVLVFVGLKMTFLNEMYGGKFPIGLSLGIIATLIGGSILVSVIIDRKRQLKNGSV